VGREEVVREGVGRGVRVSDLALFGFACVPLATYCLLTTVASFVFTLIRTRSSILLWQIAIQHEILLGDLKRAKSLFYRAIQACPWSKGSSRYPCLLTDRSRNPLDRALC
jgi:hypothetical protein